MTTPLCYCLVLFLAISMVAAAQAQNPPLKVGFYWKTCPSAETIVRRTVIKAAKQNPGVAAGLIRTHFHDCFVRGCDGSVLLDSVPGKPSELDNVANDPRSSVGLRGLEVIDGAKAKIEAQCPNTVSCSDILAFAARDGAFALGGIDYKVPAGRRDGRISREIEARTLPAPNFNVTQLKENFAEKGLSLDEMVTLSGAHSIGLSRCSAFTNRLYSFNSTHPQDPSIDRAFAAQLKAKCPESSDSDGAVPLNTLTPNRLDVAYYRNLIKGKGVLTSDQVLFVDSSTRPLVLYNAYHGRAWALKYGKAMVHMGSIDVLTGRQGEIRKNCRIVN